MTQTLALRKTSSLSECQRNKKKVNTAATLMAGILISSLTSTTIGYVPATTTSLSLHNYKQQHNVHNHHHLISKAGVSHQSASAPLFGRISPKLSLLGPKNTIHSFSDSIACKASSDNESGEATDVVEWNALIASFQMYKAAYGDLKVPARFVVPSMPPWPEPGWGLKLGQRVAAIRATGKYVQNDEERRKVLDDLGFLWRLRASGSQKKMDGITFDQVLAALTTYRQEMQPDSGTLRIPANFVVPDIDPWPENTRGLPLGSKIGTIRSKAYLKANPGATEQLAKIGFEFDGKVAANDERYNRVYSALVKYKELNGDLLVPQPFVIPENSSDWPEETWGLRLGARVNAIRSQGTFVKTNPSRREELNELGFVWEKPVSSAEKKRGRKKKVVNEALLGPAPPGILSSEEANGGIPQPPVFDETSLLGKSMSEAPKWDMLGEELIPTESQVEDVDWKPPPDFADTNILAQKRAIEVGIVKSIGEHDSIVKGHIEMEHPWFNDDFGGEFVFEDVVEALTVYKSIYGTLENIDLDEFVVPNPDDFGLMDPDADVDINGSIGDDMATVGESALSDEDLISKEIEQMELEMQSGIPAPAVEPTTEDLLMEQQRLDGPTATLSASSAVTSNSHWPEHLVGMQLGPIVRRIQEGDLEVKHLPERKKQLDDIGFDWGDEKKFLDVPFDKAMCAMFAYYMIRGDLFVYEDFVMPDEDPWPRALAGFELGKAIFRLRAKQNFLEAYYPKKKYMLNMIEFVWFPLDALPLDPDAPPLSWEHEHVLHMGHPLARINAPPFSAVEHVHPVDHPEAKDRYEFDFELVRDYYENELGVTDIGKFLRERGFNELATEHEAKYGVAPSKSEIDEYEEEYEEDVEEEEYEEEEYEEEEYEEAVTEEELEDDDEYEEEAEDDEDDEEEFEEEEVL